MTPSKLIDSTALIFRMVSSSGSHGLHEVVRPESTAAAEILRSKRTPAGQNPLMFRSGVGRWRR